MRVKRHKSRWKAFKGAADSLKHLNGQEKPPGRTDGGAAAFCDQQISAADEMLRMCGEIRAEAESVAMLCGRITARCDETQRELDALNRLFDMIEEVLADVERQL